MSAESERQKLVMPCPHCGKSNTFDQPYPYHAGFADQGFMYSDSGHHTLVWSWLDPAAAKFFPVGTKLTNDEARTRFEQALRHAPDGGRWRFTNRARCMNCSKPIAGSILEQISYLIYPGSIVVDKGDQLVLSSQLV